MPRPRQAQITRLTLKHAQRLNTAHRALRIQTRRHLAYFSSRKLRTPVVYQRPVIRHRSRN